MRPLAQADLPAPLPLRPGRQRWLFRAALVRGPSGSETMPHESQGCQAWGRSASSSAAVPGGQGRVAACELCRLPGPALRGPAPGAMPCGHQLAPFSRPGSSALLPTLHCGPRVPRWAPFPATGRARGCRLPPPPISTPVTGTRAERARGLCGGVSVCVAPCCGGPGLPRGHMPEARSSGGGRAGQGCDPDAVAA